MEAVMTFPRLELGVSKLGRTLTAALLTVTLFLTACWTADQVIADLDVILQTANSIGAAIGVVSPVDSALVQGLAQTAIVGLAAVKTAYDAYKASGANTDLKKLQAALIAIQENLSQELAAAHIANTATVTIVTAWVGLVASTLNAILAALPGLVSPTVTTRQKVKLARGLPTKASIRAQWADNVCHGEAACVQLVH